MDASSATSAVHRPGRGRVFDTIVDAIGDTPIVRLRKLPQAHGVNATILAKLEYFNPAASVKDRIGAAMVDRDGEGRRDQCRHRADRADLRQYRHRAGLRRGLARLPAEAGDAGIDVDRAAQDAGLPRRRDRSDAGRPGHEGLDRDRRRTGAHHAQRRDAAAVQEPRQSRNSPPHHGGGNLERHRRQHRFLRRRRRHRRHHHRRRPGAQAAQAVAAGGRGRARGKPGAVGRAAYAAQDPGHRRRLHSGHPGSLGDRRDRQGQQRRPRSRPRARWRATRAFPAAFPRAPRSRRRSQIGKRPEAPARPFWPSCRRSPSAICRPRCSKEFRRWRTSRGGREP